MRWVIIRRILTVRLALLLVIDYWRICRVSKRFSGMEREEAINRICQKAGRRLKNTASLLKGVIVKIGQFLNTRYDLLPKAFTQELEGLQDSLPALPYQKIYPSIEKELGQRIEDVFLTFEKEAVAASLAQVHQAVLKDGNKVAVKILRPGIEKIVKADLSTLRLIAKVVQRIPSLRQKMDFVNLHDEFSKTILRELDGNQEMEHIKRFKQMFSAIKAPFVYEQYTTKRLLIMEYIEGSKITNEAPFRNMDRIKTAESILDCYLRQVLVYGFIHLDPHPGNILIKDNGEVCLIDFGMVAQLSNAEVKTFRYLLQSMMLGEVDGMVSCLDTLGYIPNENDREKVKQIIRHFLEIRYKGDNEGESPSFQRVVSSLRSFIQDSPIQLQAKYMFLIRCIGILITTINTIAPHINWMESLIKIGPSIFNTPIATKS